MQKSLQYPTPPAGDGLVDEIDWERGAVDRGVARYRASLVKEDAEGHQSLKSLADVEPGMAILDDVIRRSSEVIREKQRLAVGNLVSNAAKLAWAIPVLSLEAEVQTYITTRCLLSGPGGADRDFTGLVMRVAAQCQQQVEFELWRNAEKDAVKEAKAAGVWRPDYWTMLRTWSPQVDERAWKKWRDRSKHFEKAGWDKATRAHYGTMLVNEVVANAGGWFEIGMVRRGVETKRVVRISPIAEQWIQERHAFNEITRPWLVPMLVPPIPWEWREETQDNEEAVTCS